MLNKWPSKCGVAFFAVVITVCQDHGRSAPIPPPPDLDDRALPLESLNRRFLGAEEHLPWHPEELVAILGDQRGRHWDYVTSLTLSPDGNLLASSAGRYVYLWETMTMRLRTLLPSGASSVSSVAFTSDSKMLVFRDGNASVKMLDVSGAKPLEKWSCKSEWEQDRCLAVSPDGKMVAVGGSSISLWDVAGTSPKERRIPLSIGRVVMEMAFSPDSSTLATVSGVPLVYQGFINATIIMDSVITLWDLTSSPPKEKASPKGQVSTCGRLYFSPDGKTLAC